MALFTFAFFFLLLSFANAAPVIKGIALGVYPDASDPEGLRFAPMLNEVKDVGTTHVSVVVSWRQRNVRATRIAPDPAITLPDTQLVRFIRQAHQRGFEVLLFPILDLEIRRPLEWRGTLLPRHANDWWRSYERFILHYARIAQKERVALLSIGSELVSTEHWQKRWRSLIRSVRRIYHGQLLYSANWDHYAEVRFWPHVDYLGITGYNELTRDLDAPEAVLFDTWTGVRDRVYGFARKINKPLILTEVGYTSQDGAAVHPWDYTSRNSIDLEEQRRCYAAFTRAWGNPDHLAGVFFWNWWGPGGTTDTNYTPKGKPAEAVLRAFFRAPPSATQPFVPTAANESPLVHPTTTK